jgi:hypothetical protein
VVEKSLVVAVKSLAEVAGELNGDGSKQQDNRC